MSVANSPITAHVLDAALGKPAQGVPIKLQKYRKIANSASGGELFAFDPIAHGETDTDGRCMDLLVPTRDSVADLAVLTPGQYKIIFQTKDYFDATNRECFYPWVEITFNITETDKHYHIPLLLSQYSFTTYRGS